ncbi:MAG: CTP synthetase [Pseudotabrizicola sp.]|nr:CTP synthetase [Pseudotabrizicola sp.]MDO8882040.1 CTP synthetase [Pseudotabrizicola sp.]MDP2080784.1 CTP synthetase [Pseudotabrizicola sp.]MDZ7574630.1 CTP synthetase [Pseudotabrizicola sp.]
MTRLTALLFSIIAPSLMGIAVIVALTTGLDTLQPIIVAATIGFFAAFPVSWIVAKQLA